MSKFSNAPATSPWSTARWISQRRVGRLRRLISEDRANRRASSRGSESASACSARSSMAGVRVASRARAMAVRRRTSGAETLAADADSAWAAAIAARAS